MTTEEAVYVIAQRNNIILDKYLDKEMVERVRVLYQQLIPTTQVSVKKIREKVKEAPAKPRVIKIGKGIEFDDPFLSQKKITEAREMADVYPLIYVLENSIRELIDRIMTAQYGKNWWDSQAPESLRKEVDIRMTTDKKDSWHQRRGDRPIDYIDFKDLPRLMAKIESSVVPNIIPDLEWFRQFVKEVYKSRCVVCHMNPLDINNIQGVQVKFNQWQKQIVAKQHLIPKSN